MKFCTVDDRAQWDFDFNANGDIRAERPAQDLTLTPWPLIPSPFLDPDDHLNWKLLLRPHSVLQCALLESTLIHFLLTSY